jgi:hypothetical protein
MADYQDIAYSFLNSWLGIVSSIITIILALIGTYKFLKNKIKTKIDYFIEERIDAPDKGLDAIIQRKLDSIITPTLEFYDEAVKTMRNLETDFLSIGDLINEEIKLFLEIIQEFQASDVGKFVEKYKQFLIIIEKRIGNIENDSDTKLYFYNKLKSITKKLIELNCVDMARQSFEILNKLSSDKEKNEQDDIIIIEIKLLCSENEKKKALTKFDSLLNIASKKYFSDYDKLEYMKYIEKELNCLEVLWQEGYLKRRKKFLEE